MAKVRKRKYRELSDVDKAKLKKRRISVVIFALVVSTLTFVIWQDAIVSSSGLFAAGIIGTVFFYFKDSFKKSARIRKMESVFPDFLQLVSSNLRAGMTIEKSLMLSARAEFHPLDTEIINTGKDIATGVNIEKSLKDMSTRIGSEGIKKTILIIISGLRAGGDLAVLLDETAVNMRQREFVQKRATSQVLMYVIFIFFAVAIFAPGLFSLSNVLVETLDTIIGGLDTSQVQSSGMISFNKLEVSLSFIFWYSIVFIVTSDLLASLVMGLVNKGEEREGLKLFPWILALSLGVFLLLKWAISSVMGGLISGVGTG
jgi:flagellar protein FlaJ